MSTLLTKYGYQKKVGAEFADQKMRYKKYVERAFQNSDCGLAQTVGLLSQILIRLWWGKCYVVYAE